MYIHLNVQFGVESRIVSNHENSSLEGGGGVHDVLQDDALQLFWIHLIRAQRDAVK